MPFDVIITAVEGGIGEAATAFNAAELTGLDSASAAFEAGITDANAFDFAQGPDGLLGSVIPGGGGDIGVEGWYNVDYEQSFVGSDAQSALFDGGGSGVDSDIYNGGTFEGGGGVGDAAAVDGGGVYDYDTPNAGVQTDYAVPVDVNNSAAEAARLERFNEAGLPTAQPNLVDQITGRASLIADQVKAAGANAVASLTTQVQAEIPKLIAQAKQQAVSQAIGAVTGTAKSFVAKSLPPKLAAVANNLVDKAANNTASALGANSVPATDVANYGGGDGGNGLTGTTFAGGGGAATTTAAGLVDATITDIKNYGNQLYSDTARGVQSFAAGIVSNATATGQNAEASAAATAAVSAALSGLAAGAAGTLNESAAETARLAAAEAYAKTLLTQKGQVIAAQRKIANNGDWRVRISLAPGADYLYNDPSMQGDTTNSILWPLKQSGGVIFPYTPKITTSYNATYSRADLTHSNYTNYFYQGSSVGEIGITAKFTAQDSMEAQYLLAVIHFFRSVTRMFYGRDPQRGAPPPLVFLTGFGEFQFQNHPCVVSSFTYDMPENVDYIRARSLNVNGADMLTRQYRPEAVPGDPVSGAYKRLAALFSGQGVTQGAQSNSSPTALESPPALGLNNPTYVPTSVDLSIRLYPVQSRSQVSQQFSVKKFASGQLISGGFW
jgi:hypothetical protein